MSLRLYLFSLYLGMVISLALGILLLTNVNPYIAPVWIILTWYFCLFVFITGMFAISGFYLKVWLSNREVIFSYLLPTLRQAMIVSLIIVGLLFLLQIKVLNWWVGILFTISIIMLEFFFRSRQ